MKANEDGPMNLPRLTLKSCRQKLRFAMMAVALALSGCGSEVSLRTGPIEPRVQRSVDAVRLDPTAAVAMLTAYRVSHGLSPVRLDPTLTAMAQRQADAMVKGNELSHDVAGSFTSRVFAAGLDTPRAAENVGGGYYSLEEAFTGWKESPGHNANLLMPQATRFGIAIAKDARTTLRVYWAMEVAAEPERRNENAALLTSATGLPLVVHQ
jgi:hypothetical protein